MSDLSSNAECDDCNPSVSRYCLLIPRNEIHFRRNCSQFTCPLPYFAEVCTLYMSVGDFLFHSLVLSCRWSWIIIDNNSTLVIRKLWLAHNLCDDIIKNLWITKLPKFRKIAHSLCDNIIKRLWITKLLQKSY